METENKKKVEEKEEDDFMGFIGNFIAFISLIFVLIEAFHKGLDYTLEHWFDFILAWFALYFVICAIVIAIRGFAYLGGYNK